MGRVPSLSVRTMDDPPMAPEAALWALKEGNKRYLCGDVNAKPVCPRVRDALKNQGQRPMATVLGCADSRVTLDHIFDTNPGDLFVLKNAGNACGHRSGGIIGSMEYSIGNLQTQLVIVLGHTNCGAVAAATGVRISNSTEGLSEGLKALVGCFEKPVDQAITKMGSDRPQPDLVEYAIKVNIWHQIEELIRNSSVIKDSLLKGTLQIHGGVFCLQDGHVEWMGEHPYQSELLNGVSDITCGVCTTFKPDMDITQSLSVRTTKDPPMPPKDALKALKAGNDRYLSGDVAVKQVCGGVRGALKKFGQRPMASVLGCADSRVALDFIFDTNPGDLFVVRNAGNVCGDISGGLIGSLEYSVANLKTQLLVVLGHTNCGAVAATAGTRISRSTEGLSDSLKALVSRLEVPVDEAIKQSKPGESQANIVELGIKLNVWHTIEELIRNSSVVKSALLAGTLEIHGGVYCLQDGHVDWMGEHPEQLKLLNNSDGVVCGTCVKQVVV